MGKLTNSLCKNKSETGQIEEQSAPEATATGGKSAETFGDMAGVLEEELEKQMAKVEAEEKELQALELKREKVRKVKNYRPEM